MKLQRKIHTVYAGFTFGAMFILLLPFFYILIQIKPWRKYAYNLNKWWAKFYFKLIFKKVSVIINSEIKKDQVYIYCPNHFSYLDIPVVGYAPNNFIFLGKTELGRVPLFGYMFRKLHITVDRENRKKSYQTYQKSIETVKSGRSLVIFPEGGIVSDEPPQMGRFKDGPFRIAIEQQIPVIPVTIPYNWIILPENKRIQLNKGEIKVIFHEPIDTAGMDNSDIKPLKEKVYQIIDHELKKHNA